MTSFRDKVTEEVKAAAEDSNDNDTQETLDQIEVDFDDIPFVKFYPTTLLSGTFPTDEGNPIIRFPDRSNNDGRQDQGYLGLVMDDVSILTDSDEGMEDATILETGESDSTEYRAVNFDDNQTTEKFGGDGVDISGDTYEVQDRHTQIDGRAIVIVDRTASVSVARKLDVNGATFAGMDEETGNVNGGLIEYAPNDEDTPVSRRYARNPELREELYGEEVGVMVTRRSDADSGTTGYLGEDGDANDGQPVVGVGDDGDTHTDPSRATFEELVAADERRDMMWYSVFDMNTGESIEPTEGEPVGYTYLEWRFDATAGNLPEEDWDFVQEYIEAGAPTDEDTILQNIEENADELSEEPNTDRMVTLIQNEAGQ
jgi:hypothetical protein